MAATRYQSDFLTDPITVAAGQSATVETEIFAGAKEVNKINAYAAGPHSIGGSTG